MPEGYTEAINRENAETPLEAAARLEALGGGVAQARREEREADAVIADIDDYVAATDPASLPEAERQLEAWAIPDGPLEGVPADVALSPDREMEPLVAVFAAHSASEASIIRGLLEAEGIPAVSDDLSAPVMGSIFQSGETRWGDVLVPARLAGQARAAIALSLEQ